MSDWLKDHLARLQAEGDQWTAALRDHPEFEESSAELARAYDRVVRIEKECGVPPQHVIGGLTSGAVEWVLLHYGEDKS